MTDEKTPETPERAMVIVAHPDDAEFGAAGTVKKWTDSGVEVWYVIATNGDQGTSDRDRDPIELAKTREKEQEAACEVLGAKGVRFLRHHDGDLEDAEPLRGEVVRLIRELRPDTIITFEPYRKSHNHRDHRVIGQVTLDAVYPFARDHLSYPEHLKEGLEPHKVAEVLLFASDDGDYHVDINDTIHTKIEALTCHVSQMGPPPHDKLRERIEEWGKSAAEGHDMEFAEAFRRLELRR